jgi:plasmid stabilization system protein ParE
MDFEVVFLLGADIDFLEIYTERGERFSHDVQETLRLLGRNPWLGPRRAGNLRRLLVSRTPYAQFYRIEGSRIFITNIVDLRQDPAQIIRKLGSLP